MADRERPRARTAEPPVTIRRATPDDIEDVVRLRLALLREYPEHPIYGRLRHDPERFARPVFAAQLESSAEITFLAESGTRVVGILRAVETTTAPFLVPDRYCYVSSVYVVPTHRRRGVLRRLAERAAEWCRQRGLGEMRLHSVGSPAPAAAAWDALGFDVVEQVRVRRLAAAADQRVADGFSADRRGTVGDASRHP